MKVKWLLLPVTVILLVLFTTNSAIAYNQNPNLNWGTTNIIEGILPPPGLHLSSYIVHYNSDKFRDLDGDHEINSMTYNPQLVWVSDDKLFDDFTYGVEAQLPIHSFNVESDFLSSKPGVVGDFIFGPFIGRTEKLGSDWFLHWFCELSTYVPIGQHDKDYAINPSANFWTIEPYLAATLQMPHGWSISTRQHFTYNFTNSDYIDPATGIETDIQPGSMWHFNFAVSKTMDFLDPNLRLGLVGYYGKQLERCDMDDVSNRDEKEEIFGIGPGIHWMRNNVIYSLKTYFEDSVEYATEGNRVVFRMITSF